MSDVFTWLNCATAKLDWMLGSRKIKCLISLAFFMLRKKVQDTCHYFQWTWTNGAIAMDN